jgi:hypothetical protein
MGEPANGALACCELGSRQLLPSLAFGHRLSLSASRQSLVAATVAEVKPTIDGEKIDARLHPRLPDRRFQRI